MTRQDRLLDHSRTPRRTYTDPGRAADWGNAVVVAGVLSAAVVVAAVAIAVYDTSVLSVSRHHTTASEHSRTAGEDGRSVETSGKAR